MRARDDILLRQVAGENILIPTGESSMRIHGMIILNESGVALWNALSDRDCQENDLVDALCEEYDVTENAARADVRDFVRQMEKVGVLR